jgi:hypothetical protein
MDFFQTVVYISAFVDILVNAITFLLMFVNYLFIVVVLPYIKLFK